MPSESLTILPGTLTLCRLPPDSPAPAQTAVFVVRNDNALWIAYEGECAPANVECEPGWRALKLQPVTAMVMASSTLANAGVRYLSLATEDASYLLVKAEQFELAVTTLTRAGGISDVKTHSERIIVRCAWRAPDEQPRFHATFEAEVIEYDYDLDRWLVRLLALRATDADPATRALIEAQLGRWAYVPSEARRGLTLPLKFQTLTGQIRYFYARDPREKA
jgi:hypothetical protein